jgi:hypothetical protein
MKGKANRSSRRLEPTYPSLPAILIAALVGGAMLQYIEFVFMSATDDNGHSFDIPMWRVHMGSACLGSVAFMIALFCFEALERRSKSLALRLTVPWIPLVGITGLATIIHIPIAIVVVCSLVYVVWAYRRFRTMKLGLE